MSHWKEATSPHRETSETRAGGLGRSQHHCGFWGLAAHRHPRSPQRREAGSFSASPPPFNATFVKVMYSFENAWQQNFSFNDKH